VTALIKLLPQGAAPWAMPFTMPVNIMRDPDNHELIEALAKDIGARLLGGEILGHTIGRVGVTSTGNSEHEERLLWSAELEATIH
jgi:hypothetical protein